MISAVAALLAKSEIKKLKIQLDHNNERGVFGKTKTKIEKNDKNSGFIVGISTGDVNVREEK